MATSQSRVRAIVTFPSRLVWAVLLGAVILVGSAALVTATNEPQPVSSPTVYAAHTAAPGAPISPAAALQGALGRMPQGALVSASIGAPPAGPPSEHRAGLPWMYATVSATALDQGLDVKPLWAADLVEGAVAELSGASPDLYTDFGGASFLARLPDGKMADMGGGIGDVTRGQVFDTSPDSSVDAGVQSTLQKFGLKPVSVAVFHPLANAVAVVAMTSDVPGTLGEFGTIRDALFGSPPKFEGYYFELRDVNGAPLVRASAAFRTATGRFWVAPEHAGEVVGEMMLGRPQH